MAGDATENLVRLIHGSPTRIVLAATGGGSEAISRLLVVPGASRTLLEAIVPYAAAALDEWLAARPEHYCSPQTARAMAMAAFERARALVADESPPADALLLAGVGCTASLASDRPKRGPHRAHIAVQTANRTESWAIGLARDGRSRAAEESLVADALLNAVAAACGVSERLPIAIDDGDDCDHAAATAPESWSELLLGLRQRVSVTNGGDVADTSTGEPRVVFPGAFHPRHDGHRQIAAVAHSLTGLLVHHEISLLNVDKPPLDFIELAERAGQFGSDEPLWFTRAATFREKADLFPGATFVVGADTIDRIAAERYYGHNAQARDAAISHLAERRCRFLVFGRTIDGRFESLTDLALPERMTALCRAVPESIFRADVSSTEVRRQAAQRDEAV